MPTSGESSHYVVVTMSALEPTLRLATTTPTHVKISTRIFSRWDPQVTSHHLTN